LGEAFTRNPDNFSEGKMSAKIAAALHQVMSTVGYIQKTGKNAFHNYKYAGEADLLEKLRPAMLDAGLLLIPSVEEVSPIDEHGNTHVRVGYTLLHKDGDVWPEKIYAAGCGGDRSKSGAVGDKGTYKAITGANKYLLFKLFQIETGDEPESDSPEERAPAQRRTPAQEASLAVVPEPSGIPEYVSISQSLLDTISSTTSDAEMDTLVRSAAFKADLAKCPPREQERIKTIGTRHRGTFRKAADLTAAG